MKAYAQSAGYAEQALNAIKVVHTYGNEELEEKNYFKYLKRSRGVQSTEVIKTALGRSVFLCVMFLFYGFAFFNGGRFRWIEGNEILEGGEVDNAYSGG